MEQRSKSVIKRLVCEYCKKEFTLACNLSTHRKIHLPKSDFKCSICDYATNIKQLLKLHMLTHTKEKPYNCPQPNCGKSFGRPSILHQHQTVHRKGDKTLRKFQCSICPFETVHRCSLNTHVKTIHSTEKPYSCELCPYKAKHNWCVKEHAKRVHLVLRPFKCPHTNCEYSTKTRNDLYKHLKRHRERPLTGPNSQNAGNTDGEEMLDGCLLCNYSSCQLNDLVVQIHGHENEGEVLDSSQISFEPGEETLNNATMISGVTHVQWSVDWGKIVYQTMGDIDRQTPESNIRVIIKVENGS